MPGQFDNLVTRADVAAVIPPESADSIITATAEQSIALSLFRRVNMGTATNALAVIDALPDAFWVNGDTGLKQTTDFKLKDVVLTAEEMAVVVVTPDAVLADSSVDLWAQIRPELASKFGRKLDLATIAGVDRPASYAQALIPAADLGAAFSLVEADGFDVTGVAANRSLRALLRGARDASGQPLADVVTGFTAFEGITLSYAPAGYSTARWRRVRDAYIAEHPRCERCGKTADDVHHRDHCRYGDATFFAWANLQALCRPCHRRETGRHAAMVKQGRA